jgi:hypothetical protein
MDVATTSWRKLACVHLMHSINLEQQLTNQNTKKHTRWQF